MHKNPVSAYHKEVDAFKKQILQTTLEAHRGNRTHAARALGISVRTLRNRISLYTARGIDVPAPHAN